MQLARRLGFELMPGLDADSCTDTTFLGALLHGAPLDAPTVFAAGPRGVDVPVEHGWVHDTMLPGGVWGIAPAVLVDRLTAHRPPVTTHDTFVLVPRREMAWSNSIRYGTVQRDGDAAPVARIGSDDAQRLGLADGFTFLYAGNLGPLQGLEVVVDAAARLRDVPGIQVAFVGTGPVEGALRAQVASLGLTNVRFVARQPASAMNAINALGDVLLVSLRDLEVMRATIPSPSCCCMARANPR